MSKRLLFLMVIIVWVIIAAATVRLCGKDKPDLRESPLAAMETESEFKMVISGFETGEHLLPADAAQTIRQVYVLLNSADDDIMITVTGYTDFTGNEDFDISLSMKRAQDVADVLIKEGIPEDDFIIIGRGAAEAVAPDDIEEHRKLNRRVEITIR